MRKILIACGIVAVLTLLGAAVAFADGGPHGNWQSTVNGVNQEDHCASCHRAHTGYANLLIRATTYELCMTCHGTVGANTDVLDGTAGASTTVNLNGGLFRADTGPGPLANPATWTAANPSPLPTGATSIHSVLPGNNVTVIPDSSKPTPTGPITLPSGTVAANTQGMMATPLDCASCHDPHGLSVNVGGVLTEQYRMLHGGPSATDVPFVASNEPRSTTATGKVQITRATKSYTSVNWKSGTSQFCATCHDVDTSTQNADGSVHRHVVDSNLVGPGYSFQTVLPLQHPTGVADASNDQLVCMTCHKPHGTNTYNPQSSTRANHSNEVGTMSYDRISGVQADSAYATYLLRMDNRGVCQDCHKLGQ